MKYPPINPKCPAFLHGGDYNPDQWPPEIWDEDMRLMRLAECNAMSLGIFSWAQLEPSEGRYTFGWLDRIMDMLARNGAFAVLATPTAAPPAWMSAKYPEILRTGADRVRRLHGNRVNTCLTSPVYREKCAGIARTLAERYRSHPALLIWHVFNEYSGDCHCELCQAAFRDWLRAKFGSLDALNAAYWTAFWGHTYTDWSQIQSPGGPYGEHAIIGLTLDWKRFVSDQTLACMQTEIDVLRAVTPEVPITTNFMGLYDGLDYWRHAEALDVVSWDNYPSYHDRPDDWRQAVSVSFIHDIYRRMKQGKPFMLMESTPSSCNWMSHMKLKRPGVHKLGSLQAVAHGSDTVQYFQWRASRGGMEKFHGAVVAHDGTEHTRVFQDVAEVGRTLRQIVSVLGTSVQAEVAIIYDWQVRWGIDSAAGPRAQGRDYPGACIGQYRPFWQWGIPVDVINSLQSFEGYRLLIAPMLYMLRPGVAERLEQFVARGGTLVTTYWSGITDENDLCFLGGRPGPLRRLLGIWSEELDVLYDDESATVRFLDDNLLGLSGEYTAHTFCDLIHAETAQVLAVYDGQFYAGRPALTVNGYGDGRAYYIASRNADDFTDAFYAVLVEHLGLRSVLDADVDQGVTVQMRTDGERDYLFLLNFTPTEQVATIHEDGIADMLTGEPVEGAVALPPYGSTVLCRLSRTDAAREGE
jgi:beta-galactosidase